MAEALAGERVEGSFSYAVWTGVKPVGETYGAGPGGLQRRGTGANESHRMSVRDARPIRSSLSLDVQGFVLADHATAMRDFFEPGAIETIYYPEMERLIAAQAGAKRVHIFDHTLRSGDAATREARQIREPLNGVHNDYTAWSGPQRVKDLLPDEAETLLQRRFAIIQAWRPINKPILRDPLALIDARSLEEKDLIAAERRFPNRVGETYAVQHNPNHQWFYFPRMQRNEAIVFKVYDSDPARARWTAHASFKDPNTPADAGPRESIEIRAFAFF
ncbi:MAG: CmcJ/NvfI family oxidoreductase [Hyphomonadaceae bacterium]